MRAAIISILVASVLASPIAIERRAASPQFDDVDFEGGDNSSRGGRGADDFMGDGDFTSDVEFPGGNKGRSGRDEVPDSGNSKERSGRERIPGNNYASRGGDNYNDNNNNNNRPGRGGRERFKPSSNFAQEDDQPCDQDQQQPDGNYESPSKMPGYQGSRGGNDSRSKGNQGSGNRPSFDKGNFQDNSEDLPCDEGSGPSNPTPSGDQQQKKKKQGEKPSGNSGSGNSGSDPNADSGNFAKDSFEGIVLAHHNAHRSNHSAPALTWDKDLADAALQLSKGCVMDHNVDIPAGSYSGYGQNLAEFSNNDPRFIGASLTNGMYNGEFAMVDFNSPSYSSGGGHLTQMVWKSSTKVGCAPYQCGSGYLVTCNYYPAGNNVGDMAANVLPPEGHPMLEGNWFYPELGDPGW